MALGAIGSIVGAGLAGYGQWAPRNRADNRAAQSQAMNMRSAAMRQVGDYQNLISKQADREAAKMIAQAMASDDPLAAVQEAQQYFPPNTSERVLGMMPELLQRLRSYYEGSPAQIKGAETTHQNRLDEIRAGASARQQALTQYGPTMQERLRAREMGYVYDETTHALRRMSPEEAEFTRGVRYKNYKGGDNATALKDKLALRKYWDKFYDDNYMIKGNGNAPARLSPSAPKDPATGQPLSKMQWVEQMVDNDIRGVEKSIAPRPTDPGEQAAPDQVWGGAPWRLPDASPKPVIPAPTNGITGAQEPAGLSRVSPPRPAPPPQPAPMPTAPDTTAATPGKNLDLNKIASVNPAVVARSFKKKAEELGLNPVDLVNAAVQLTPESKRAIIAVLQGAQ